MTTGQPQKLRHRIANLSTLFSFLFRRFFSRGTTLHRALFDRACDEVTLCAAFMIVRRKYPLTTLKIFRKMMAHNRETEEAQVVYFSLLGEAGKIEDQQTVARNLLQNESLLARLGEKLHSQIVQAARSLA